ncbi:MAG: MBL fold metallo-hydrolase, partial [Ruminococcaceae bacterium]|nr:MBL fold metallo-hydrolase [Oscillospiraceae bacterium]
GIDVNPTESDRTESDSSSATEYRYVGNVNSKKFHTLDCKNLPDETNRIWFTTREEAVTEGYSPCGNCDP